MRARSSRERSPDGSPEPPGHPEDALGDPESAARTICLRLLESRARSREELAGALTRRGIPDEAAQTVLDRLTEVGLIDDRALAEQLVEARHRERGLAQRALARDLQRRGIAADVAAGAIAVVDRDRERAAQLVRTRLARMSSLPEPARTRRLVSMLARKGYDSQLAFDVVRAEARDAGPAEPGRADWADDA
jgi:regulatory protein